MFAGPLDESIVARARRAGAVDLEIHNLRDWTTDRHRTADGRPFGGGAGMVLKPEPLFKAVDALRRGSESHVVLLTPQGVLLRRGKVRRAQLYYLRGLVGRAARIKERGFR